MTSFLNEAQVFLTKEIGMNLAEKIRAEFKCYVLFFQLLLARKNCFSTGPNKKTHYV